MTGERKIGFGIIGAGMIAKFHAMAIRDIDPQSLIAVFARDEEKAKAFALEFGCEAYADLDQMLGNDNITIVTIATPSGAHLEPTILAAKAGKHIICEKPLEITPNRIEKMIDVCRTNNVLLSGIFNRRFNASVTYLKEAIEQGRFGRLTLCDAQIKWFRTQAYYDSGKWRGTMELDGGGALMNQAIHTIDLLLYFVGNVKRVSASIATLTHENIEVEDNAVALLEFENGALGTIQGSTSCWSSNGHPAEIQICGSEGSVFLNDDQFRVWDFKNPLEIDDTIRSTCMSKAESGLGANDPGAINYIGHKMNFENVIAAIENGTEPLINGAESGRSVKLIHSIYESANNNGKWISL